LGDALRFVPLSLATVSVGQCFACTASVSCLWTPRAAAASARRSQPSTVSLYFFASPAFGVAHREDEDPLAPVRSACVGRPEHIPLRIEPERGQVPENGAHRSAVSKEPEDVLHKDDAGSNHANDAGELTPEPGACARKASALPGVRQVLTGESPGDDVDRFEFMFCVPCGAYVVVAARVGPVAREHAAAPLVGLDLPDRAPPGRVLHAEVEPADA